jgi:CRP-like cAMP-binding protein
MTEPISPAALQSLSFMAGATDEEVRRIAEAATWAHHPTGSVLFREGEKVTRLWIVVTGNVAIEISGPERRLHSIHTVGDGELLGWSPVIGTGPMTATARALTDIHSVTIDTGAILAMSDADPRFGYLFIRRVAAAIAARLHSTRLQLLEVYRSDLPLLHL